MGPIPSSSCPGRRKTTASSWLMRWRGHRRASPAPALAKTVGSSWLTRSQGHRWASLAPTSMQQQGPKPWARVELPLCGVATPMGAGSCTEGSVAGFAGICWLPAKPTYDSRPTTPAHNKKQVAGGCPAGLFCEAGLAGLRIGPCRLHFD